MFSLFLLVEVSYLKLGWHDESLMASSFLIDLYFSLCSRKLPDISIEAILASGEYNNIHQKCQSCRLFHLIMLTNCTNHIRCAMCCFNRVLHIYMYMTRTCK